MGGKTLTRADLADAVVQKVGLPRNESQELVELVLGDAMVEKAIDAIIASAKTGRIGDGKIFVSNVEEAVRIRTGETGNDAI